MLVRKSVRVSVVTEQIEVQFKITNAFPDATMPRVIGKWANDH